MDFFIEPNTSCIANEIKVYHIFKISHTKLYRRTEIILSMQRGTHVVQNYRIDDQTAAMDLQKNDRSVSLLRK